MVRDAGDVDFLLLGQRQDGKGTDDDLIAGVRVQRRAWTMPIKVELKFRRQNYKSGRA